MPAVAAAAVGEVFRSFPGYSGVVVVVHLGYSFLVLRRESLQICSCLLRLFEGVPDSQVWKRGMWKQDDLS